MRQIFRHMDFIRPLTNSKWLLVILFCSFETDGFFSFAVFLSSVEQNVFFFDDTNKNNFTLRTNGHHNYKWFLHRLKLKNVRFGRCPIECTVFHAIYSCFTVQFISKWTLNLNHSPIVCLEFIRKLRDYRVFHRKKLLEIFISNINKSFSVLFALHQKLAAEWKEDEGKKW